MVFKIHFEIILSNFSLDSDEDNNILMVKSKSQPETKVSSINPNKNIPMTTETQELCKYHSMFYIYTYTYT